jgi:transcriptional regulator with XRE-family HTH domain
MIGYRSLVDVTSARTGTVVPRRSETRGERVAARRAADESLVDLLAIAERRQGVSGGRALARRAAELGHDVSHTTVNQILAGRMEGRPTVATLEAIAALADVSRTRVHQAAGRPVPGRPFADELPDDVDLMTRRQRDAVLAVVRTFLDPTAVPGAAGKRSTPPAKAAARRRS